MGRRVELADDGILVGRSQRPLEARSAVLIGRARSVPLSWDDVHGCEVRSLLRVVWMAAVIDVRGRRIPLRRGIRIWSPPESLVSLATDVRRSAGTPQISPPPEETAEADLPLVLRRPLSQRVLAVGITASSVVGALFVRSVDQVGAVMLALVAVYGAVGVASVFRTALADHDGLHACGTFRRRLVPWSDISALLPPSRLERGAIVVRQAELLPMLHVPSGAWPLRRRAWPQAFGTMEWLRSQSVPDASGQRPTSRSGNA